MDSEPSEATAAATRRELIALLQQFEQATDAEARTHLLDQLETRFTPEETAQARARFEEWLLGLPPPDLQATPAYARFQTLLPRMLAGLITPGSDEYAEFADFVAEWDAALEEYQDLQATLETGYAAWSTGVPPPDFSDPDLSFLPSAPS